MITYTLNRDANNNVVSVKITDTIGYLQLNADGFAGVPGTTSNRLTLVVTLDCGTSYTKLFTTGEVQSDGSYTIVPTDIGQTSSIATGVLKIELQQELLNGVTFNFDPATAISVCVFVDNGYDIKCQINDRISEGKTMYEEVILYQGLINAETCTECDCSESCDIFKRLQHLLNIASNSTTDTDCGCSNA